jgi:hypothetical protein
MKNGGLEEVAILGAKGPVAAFAERFWGQKNVSWDRS